MYSGIKNVVNEHKNASKNRIELFILLIVMEVSFSGCKPSPHNEACLDVAVLCTNLCDTGGNYYYEYEVKNIEQCKQLCTIKHLECMK